MPLIVLVVLLMAACSSPTAPSSGPAPIPTLPTVDLRIVVVGHPSGLPKSGVPVTLQPPSGVQQSATLGALAQTTDTNGAVLWRVIPGHTYTAAVRQTTMSGLVLGDVGWLSSWPD